MNRLLAACLLLLMLPLRALAEEPRGYQKGEGYQCLQVGNYQHSKDRDEAPLLWRILDVTDGKALLLTQYVLDAPFTLALRTEASGDAQEYNAPAPEQNLAGAANFASRVATALIAAERTAQITQGSTFFARKPTVGKGESSTSDQQVIIAPRGASANAQVTNLPSPVEKNKAQNAAAQTAEIQDSTTQAMEAQNDGLQMDSAPVVLSLIGDVSIGDAYQYRGTGSSLTTAIRNNSMAWAFARVQAVLSSDSLTAANLEVCLTESKDKSGKTFPLIAPPSFVDVLTQGGVDVVNSINNHSYDFGTSGYQDTLAALEGAGIGHFGTMVDGRDNISGKTLVVERDGIRFGFAGYSYPQNETLKAMGTQIEQLREAGCDVVIISLHWGRETFMTPKNGQISYAAKIIDMGADAVWGHHPHVLQPVQFYKGKPVLFSTGNFIFGTMSKVEPASGIFQLDYRKTADGVHLEALRIIPCMTQRAPEYQPYVVLDTAGRERVWGFLRAKKTYTGYDNLPESFVSTGIVRLDALGNLLP